MNIQFSTDYFRHARSYDMAQRLIESTLYFFSDEFRVIGNKNSPEKIKNLFPASEFSFHYFAEFGIIRKLFPVEEKFFIQFDLRDGIITFKITGNDEYINHFKSLILANFKEPGVQIKWYYDKDNYAYVPVDCSQLPVKEMYPFLNNYNSLSEYYDKFLDSTASILLLIGPPGTGKTTFIRGLIHHAQQSAILSYDPAVLSQDNIFVNFISNDENQFLILEDSDAFLSARTDGNTMMHRFLNVSNGLVSSGKKKMIFSTNLPSIRDIDPALIRPGRCYDILNFETLSHDQIRALSTAVGAEYNSEASTIAEVFHQSTHNKVKQSFGFNL